ncbi:MAG: fluoride efflux transporter CrcB [Bacteroidota bacterium]
MNAYLLVFIGGGLGSLCRFGIARLLHHFSWVSLFPWATFLANALSCVLLGSLVALLQKNGPGATTKLLLITGFCGGFSTFSTFSNETFQLFQQGAVGYALLNVGGSLLVGLLGIFLGMKLVL